WVVEFRGVCVAKGLKEQALTVAARPHPDVSVVESLRTEADTVGQKLAELRAHVGWTDDYLSSVSFTESIERGEGLRQNLLLGPRWAAFELVRAKVAAGLAAELLVPAMKGEAASAAL